MTPRDHFETALAENKRQMVQAVHANDQEGLRRLSQEKQALKKQLNRYCTCGRAKGHHSFRCWFCNHRERYYSRTLAPLAAMLLALVACAQDYTEYVPSPGASSMAPQKSSFDFSPSLIVHTNHAPVPPPSVITLSWTPGTNDYSYQIWYSTNLSQPYWWFAAWVTNQTSYTNPNSFSQKFFVIRPFSSSGFTRPFGK